MADSKISALPAVTTVEAADVLVVVHAGTTYKITGANLKALFVASGAALLPANNLADLADAATARTNLGVDATPTIAVIYGSSSPAAISATTTVVNLTTTLAALTLNLPADPKDGRVCRVCVVGDAITALTVASTDGSTVAGAITAAAFAKDSHAAWLYVASMGTWVRID